MYTSALHRVRPVLHHLSSEFDQVRLPCSNIPWFPCLWWHKPNTQGTAGFERLDCFSKHYTICCFWSAASFSFLFLIAAKYWGNVFCPVRGCTCCKGAGHGHRDCRGRQNQDQTAHLVMSGPVWGVRRHKTQGSQKQHCSNWSQLETCRRISWRAGPLCYTTCFGCIALGVSPVSCLRSLLWMQPGLWKNCKTSFEIMFGTAHPATLSSERNGYWKLMDGWMLYKHLPLQRDLSSSSTIILLSSKDLQWNGAWFV